MAIDTHVVLGTSLLLAGWALARWASSYDIKGWVIDAVWRALFRRDCKRLRTTGARELLDSDPTLEGQIME